MKKGMKIFKTAAKAAVILIYISMIVFLMLQALTPGEESAAISGDFGDKLNDVVTNIQKPDVEKVSVAGVEIHGIKIGGETLSGDSIAISVGEQGSVQASVLPHNATNRALLYSSEDESVAFVYADGRIVAKSSGTTVIQVRSDEDSSILATIEVSVVRILPESIGIVNLPDHFHVGDIHRLELDFTPNDSSDKGVSWHSSDSSVITVDEHGTLTAVGEGEATISAVSLVDDSISSSVSITVLEATEAPQITPTSISIVSGQSEYTVGSTATFGAELYPSGAEGKVIWYTSDDSVATISQSGKLVCRSAGSAYIIARAGQLEARILITVKEKLSENIYLHYQDIGESDGVRTMKQGDSGRVVATLDEDATVYDLSFSSSNEWVATIGADGMIQARHGGKTTITVSTYYGGDSTTVSFELFVERITLEDTIDNFYTWVRKAIGHFGAFLILGIFAAMTYLIIFKKDLKGKLIAFLVCIAAGFAVAGITEILQMPIFTTGRGPSFSDVMLDFTGYCTSVVPIYAIVLPVRLISDIVKVLKEKKCKRA